MPKFVVKITYDFVEDIVDTDSDDFKEWFDGRDGPIDEEVIQEFVSEDPAIFGDPADQGILSIAVSPLK